MANGIGLTSIGTKVSFNPIVRLLRRQSAQSLRKSGSLAQLEANATGADATYSQRHRNLQILLVRNTKRLTYLTWPSLREFHGTTASMRPLSTGPSPIPPMISSAISAKI